MTITKKWLKFRREYLKAHPPDYKGDYICGICQMPVHYKEVNLDHILDRSTHPHLRFDESNIQFAHYSCNIAKKFS